MILIEGDVNVYFYQNAWLTPNACILKGGHQMTKT
jgi:hypothetical protein